MILESIPFWQNALHPLGADRYVRWAAFGLALLVFIVLPLLMRKKQGSTREGRALYATTATALWLPVGIVVLLAALAMLVFPYLPWNYGDANEVVRELEWKVFNPFDDSDNTNRTILILLVIPLVVGLPLAQYFFMRREVRGPMRLMMAGLRIMVLWLIFILLCAPYISITPKREVAWRSAVMVDASTSMQHRADPLSPFAILVLPKALERDPEISALASEDAEAASELRAYLSGKLGLPVKDSDMHKVNVSNPTVEYFEQREFVRRLIRHRATRLLRKVQLLRGARPDFEELTGQRAKLAENEKQLELVLSDLFIERTKSRSDEIPRLQRSENELRRRIEGIETSIAKVLQGGDVFNQLKNQRDAAEAGSAEADRLAQFEERMITAMRALVENLTSVLHKEGPTRWDIATEMLMPGMGRSQNDADMGLPLAIGDEKLAILDLFRQNEGAQNDRLPEDIAEFVIQAAGSPSESYRAILSQLRSDGAIPEDINEISNKRDDTDLLSVYTFSAPDFGALSSRSYNQVSLEELDFLLPKGPMTKLFHSYASVLRKENSGDLANFLIISDGVETSSDVEEQLRDAVGLRASLEGNANAPKIFSVVVGYSSVGKELELAKVKAPDAALVDELINVELTVKANYDWKDVEVILERETGLEDDEAIKYSILNDVAGKTKVDVVRQPGTNGTFLNFVNLSFTPEVDESDEKAKRDKRGRRYWEYTLIFRLNEEARPGEMTYDNNVLKHKIVIREHKIRVLYIDQRFRYETRYLLEAMARDKTLEMQSFIVEADPQWPQRTSEYSTKVMRRMPHLVLPFCKIQNEGKSGSTTTQATTFEDWMSTNYDVVILGDVHSQYLGDRGREWLARFVRERKGGLIFLAGQYNMPWSYQSGDVAEIIPVKYSRESADRRVDTTSQHFYGVTPIGFSSEVLELSLDRKRQAELWGTTQGKSDFERGQLDGFYWYAKTDGPKDSSSMVFARVARDKSKLYFEFDDNKASDALIVGREEEEGRTLFMGTDEFWRMRRYFGDFYTYRIWQNSIRWAAARRLDLASDDFEIFTDQRSYQLGSEVNAFCDFVGDQSVITQVQRAQAKKRNELAIGSKDDAKKALPVLLEWRLISTDVDDVGRKNRSDLIVGKSSHSKRRFEGKFTPSVPGEYQITLVNDSYKERQPWFFRVEASTEAEREKDEMSNISGENMRELAALKLEAGQSGEDLDEDEAARWFASFEKIHTLKPVKRFTEVYDGSEITKAWNLIELMIILALLLGVEWFVRKLVRLA